MLQNQSLSELKLESQVLRDEHREGGPEGINSNLKR